MPTITNYINAKFWENGDMTLSFKMDDFTREKLAQVPQNTYVKIGPSNFAKGGWAMYWTEPKGEPAHG